MTTTTAAADNEVPFGPSKADYVSAAIYARVMGSNSGSYVTESAGMTPEASAEVTAHVVRVEGSWRVKGCCDRNTLSCHECHELFKALDTPPVPAVAFTPEDDQFALDLVHGVALREDAERNA